MLCVLWCLILTLRAGEGMWLPLLISSLNEAEMKAMGMKMSAEDIYSVNRGSLKDAIVHFGGFCTGEVISMAGLILTNHHCGYEEIQSHSTPARNLLAGGFWAASKQDELPCPGLFVTFIVRIEDVTADVLDKVKDKLSPEERQSLIDQNIRATVERTQKESYQQAFVRPFFEGNQYFLFVTERYNDIRLVGAPPESIGKFGADTDNWEWPRHTGDFCLFRIYASPDNTPADYSASNIPFKPRHALPVSTGGVREGDFTLVFGFPGRTDQYLTSHAVTQLIEVINPARIAIRDISLGIMDREMRKNEVTRLKFAPRYASLSNSWKKWIGERQGLIQSRAVDKKRTHEVQFTELINRKGKTEKSYGHLLPEFAEIYAQTGLLEKARIYYSEIFGVNVQLFQLVSRLSQLRTVYLNNGEDAFKSAAARQRGWLTNFFQGFDTDIDREVCEALLEHMTNTLEPRMLPDVITVEGMFARGTTHRQMTGEIYSGTVLSVSALLALLDSPGEEFVATLESIPAFVLFAAVQEKNNADIASVYNVYRSRLNALQREWVTAQMEMMQGRRFWPDANNTMRITYGHVEGYEPRDAVRYYHVTYLDGVIAKYKPGDYEFDLPQKLIDLYERKDYGRYADKVNGKLPVCFLGSNHTTGGNSGSPAIDAHGNLIGINFDRVWEGTMSDISYDRSICRNIMVDVRYILFIIDKFAGAGHLIDEMTLVNPRT